MIHHTRSGQISQKQDERNNFYFYSLLTKSQFPPPHFPTKLTFSSYNPIKTSFLAVATPVPFLF